MGLVDSVTGYFRNIVNGGKDIFKRNIEFESLEFMISAATAYIGGTWAASYFGTVAGTILGTGVGYIAGHLAFLPFDLYKGLENTIEAIKVGFGRPADSAAYAH